MSNDKAQMSNVELIDIDMISSAAGKPADYEK